MFGQLPKKAQKQSFPDRHTYLDTFFMPMDSLYLVFNDDKATVYPELEGSQFELAFFTL